MNSEVSEACHPGGYPRISTLTLPNSIKEDKNVEVILNRQSNTDILDDVEVEATDNAEELTDTQNIEDDRDEFSNPLAAEESVRNAQYNVDLTLKSEPTLNKLLMHWRPPGAEDIIADTSVNEALERERNKSAFEKLDLRTSEDKVLLRDEPKYWNGRYRNAPSEALEDDEFAIIPGPKYNIPRKPTRTVIYKDDMDWNLKNRSVRSIKKTSSQVIDIKNEEEEVVKESIYDKYRKKKLKRRCPLIPEKLMKFLYFLLAIFTFLIIVNIIILYLVYFRRRVNITMCDLNRAYLPNGTLIVTDFNGTNGTHISQTITTLSYSISSEIPQNTQSSLLSSTIISTYVSSSSELSTGSPLTTYEPTTQINSTHSLTSSYDTPSSQLSSSESHSTSIMSSTLSNTISSSTLAASSSIPIFSTTSSDISSIDETPNTSSFTSYSNSSTLSTVISTTSSGTYYSNSESSTIISLNTSSSFTNEAPSSASFSSTLTLSTSTADNSTIISIPITSTDTSTISSSTDTSSDSSLSFSSTIKNSETPSLTTTTLTSEASESSVKGDYCYQLDSASGYLTIEECSICAEGNGDCKHLNMTTSSTLRGVPVIIDPNIIADSPYPLVIKGADMVQFLPCTSTTPPIRNVDIVTSSIEDVNNHATFLNGCKIKSLTLSIEKLSYPAFTAVENSSFIFSFTDQGDNKAFSKIQGRVGNFTVFARSTSYLMQICPIYYNFSCIEI